MAENNCQYNQISLTCDSVVRAPIAPQATRSAVYCGVIVSEYSLMGIDSQHVFGNSIPRNSHPTGRPSPAISRRSPRAMRRPLLIWKLKPNVIGAGKACFHDEPAVHVRVCRVRLQSMFCLWGELKTGTHAIDKSLPPHSCSWPGIRSYSDYAVFTFSRSGHFSK